MENKNPVDFPTLKLSRSVDDSKAINESEEPSIIISASGMCEAGRIRHHLKHHLWRENSTVLFVGYQAIGTLGRRLVDGEKQIRIFGEDINVKARVEYIEGFSGHADQTGLINWLNAFEKKPETIFVVHGESEAQDTFASIITDTFGIRTIVPNRGDVFEIKDLYATQVGEESADRKYRFMCLEILEKLNLLKDEVDEMCLIVKDDLRDGMGEEEFEEMKGRLRKVEKSIIAVLE